MADLKPSTAPAADALDGTELIPCTQGGTSKALTPAQFGTYSAAHGSDLVVGAPASGATVLSSAGSNKMQLAFVLVPLNGTASAPGLSFNHSGVNSGAWYDSANGALVFEINAENRMSIEHGSYRLRMSSPGEVVWSSTTSATNNPPDAGLKRLAAGKLAVSDGQSGIGSLNGLRPPTSASGPATTVQLPNSGESCVHTDTATGFTYFAFNSGGTIRSAQLL